MKKEILTGILLAIVAVVSHIVSAFDPITDINFSNGHLSIEYNNEDTKYSDLLAVGYDKSGCLISVSNSKINNNSGNLDLFADYNVSDVVLYGIENDSSISLLKRHHVDSGANDIILPAGGEFYESCYIHINYISALKRGSYDKNGIFHEGNTGYSSDIFNAEGLVLSVETYYHTLSIDVITKNQNGIYDIKHINSDVYTFEKNDVAFTIVRSDGGMLSDSEFNTINQQISMSCSIDLDDGHRVESHFSRPFTLWSEEDKNNKYESWPFSNCWYDESDDTVNIIYTSGSDHLSYIGKFAIYHRKIYSDNSVSQAIPVTSDENIGYNASSSNILSDGTYIAYIYDRDNKISYLYSSNDKGSTWNSKPMIFDLGSDSSVVSITGMKEIEKKYIIAFATMSDDTFRIIKSSDGGVTWNSVTSDVNKYGKQLEGTFVSLSDNRLICIMRGVLGQPPYTKEASTYMIKSSDNGRTWSKLIELDLIDASYNPVSALYHKDDKTVELLYGSRYVREDYCGSINHMIISESDLWNADFSNTKEERLYKAPASRDFGYFTMAETKDGTIKAFFYSGIDANTNIYCMIKTN